MVHVIACVSQKLRDKYLDIRMSIMEGFSSGLVLPNDDHHQFYLALYEQKPIGCYQLEILNERVMAVRFLGVIPEHRKQGFGRKIIHALEHNLPYHKPNLLLYLNSCTPTVPFYAKHGFVKGPHLGSPLIEDSIGMYKSLD